MARIGFRILLLACWLGLSAHGQSSTFVNPLLPSGADPWVIVHDGFYYYMNSTGTNLTLWKTRDITDLAHAEKRVVWTPPSTGPYSHEIWAPELHRLDGRWFIYFAADDGSNDHHRIWVIENDAADPIQGSWTFRGKVADPTTSGPSTRRCSPSAAATTWCGPVGRAIRTASRVSISPG